MDGRFGFNVEWISPSVSESYQSGVKIYQTLVSRSHSAMRMSFVE